MNFALNISAFLCSLCLGLSFAASLKIIFPFRKAKSPSNFIFACIFLTGAVVLYTFLIFKMENLFPFSKLAESENSAFSFYAFAVGFFCFGCLLFLFWKILLPVSMIFVIFFTILTNHLLIKVFGSQKMTIPISVNENSFSLNQKEISKTEENFKNQNLTIKITSYKMSDTFFLPVRRNWFSTDQNFSAEKNAFPENPILGFYFEKFVLSGTFSLFNAHISDDGEYPSLYSAHFSFKNDILYCEIRRDL